MLLPNNVGGEYGNTQFNVPNRFVVSMVVNSPWHVKGPLGYLANGWQMAPIFQAQNGLPYSVGTSGTAPGVLASGGGINGSYGTSRIGLLARDIYNMPGTQNLDWRITKTITLKEKYSLDLMGEAFNLFNHYNVTGVGTTGYTVSKSGTISDTNGATQNCSSATPCLSYNASSFGIPTTANSNFAYSTRQIQIGLKFKF
jgi:hypothetical protein